MSASKNEPAQKMKKNEIKISDIEDKIWKEWVFHACDFCKLTSKIVCRHGGI